MEGLAEDAGADAVADDRSVRVGDVEPDVLLTPQPEADSRFDELGEKSAGNLVLITGLSSSFSRSVTANAVAVATSRAATISVGASRFNLRS